MPPQLGCCDLLKGKCTSSTEAPGGRVSKDQLSSVVCRLEWISYVGTKCVVTANYVAILLGLCGVIVMMVYKFTGDGLALLANNHLAVADVVILSFCIAFLLAGITVLAVGLYKTRHSKWDALRKHLVVSNMVLMFSSLLVDVSDLSRNIVVVSARCWWLHTPATLFTVMVYLSYTGYNMFFAIMVLQAYRMCPPLGLMPWIGRHVAAAAASCWAAVMKAITGCQPASGVRGASPDKDTAELQQVVTASQGSYELCTTDSERSATAAEVAIHAATTTPSDAAVQATTPQAERETVTTSVMPPWADEVSKSPQQLLQAAVRQDGVSTARTESSAHLHSNEAAASNRSDEPSQNGVMAHRCVGVVTEDEGGKFHGASISWSTGHAAAVLADTVSSAKSVELEGHPAATQEDAELTAKKQVMCSGNRLQLLQVPSTIERWHTRWLVANFHIMLLWVAAQIIITLVMVSDLRGPSLTLEDITEGNAAFSSAAETISLLTHYMGHEDVWTTLLLNGKPPQPWVVPYYTGETAGPEKRQQIFGPHPLWKNKTNVFMIGDPEHPDLLFPQTEANLPSTPTGNAEFALDSALGQFLFTTFPYMAYCADAHASHWAHVVQAVRNNSLVFRQQYEPLGLPLTCTNAPLADGTCNGFKCPVEDFNVKLGAAVNFFALLYLLLYIWHLGHACVALRRFSYTRYRFAHICLRLQRREGAVVMFAIFVSITLLAYVRPTVCASQIIAQLGVVPVHFMVAVMLTCRAWYSAPQVERPAVLLCLEKQIFAWSEKDVAALKRARSCHAEPVFCYETCLRAMFWTIVAYRDTRELPVKEPTFTMARSIEFEGWTGHEQIVQLDDDFALVAAWKPGLVVVSFRGTVSLKNVASDAQALQTPHARMVRKATGWRTWWPSRSPHVHKGFWRMWDGMRLEVLCLLERAVECALQGGPSSSSGCCTLLVTGHSMGGALGTLCAWDTAQLIQQKGWQATVALEVYTFGAPRVGNHSFARSYKAAVPASFDIVNDQDVVPKASKWLRVYKRSGHRVIISRKGDIIVRPSYLELNITQSSVNSVKDHRISRYQGALAAVAAAQFSQLKNVEGGLAGLMRIWKDPIGRRLMIDVLDADLDDLRNSPIGRAGSKHMLLSNEDEQLHTARQTLQTAFQEVGMLVQQVNPAAQKGADVDADC